MRRRIALAFLVTLGGGSAARAEDDPIAPWPDGAAAAPAKTRLGEIGR